MNGLKQLKYDREHFAEMFEHYAMSFASKERIMTLFQYSVTEMDEKCIIEYGMNFQKSLSYFCAIATMECQEVIDELAKQGNGVALKIANENIWKLNEQESKKSSAITIVMGKVED